MMRYLLSVLVALALSAPAAAQSNLAGATLRTTDTTASSVKVGCTSTSTTCTGGIRAGQMIINGVTIIGTDGRIPAISSTYFASLSAANLTGIVETAIVDGALLARVADNETISGRWLNTNIRGLEVSSTAPQFWWSETGAAANAGKWQMNGDGGIFTFQTVNDAESGTATIFQVARTGTVVDTMTMGAAKTIYPVGSAAAPSIALTEAVGTANDSGFYYAAGSVSIASQGTQVAFFNTTAATIGASNALSAITINGGTSIFNAAASTALTVGATSATPISIDRSTSDGTMIDILRAGVSVGSVSVAAGVVAYNTFLGDHYTQLLPGQDEPEQGTVVVSAGVIPALPRKLTKLQNGTPDEVTDSPASVDPAAERFVYVRPSTRRNQKGVYGLWHADLGRTAAGMSWGDPDAEVYQVSGLGLTTGWVTDTCGPITAGDFLASSPVEGLAERQCTVSTGGKPGYDPVNRDYTLGKSLVDVDFSKVAPDADGVRKVRIPLTLKAS